MEAAEAAAVGGAITRIVLLDRRRGRVNVFLDDRFAFELSASLAADLARGQTLTPKQIADLRTRDEGARAMDIGLRQLARRPRSRAELAEHLAGKGIAAEVADAVCDRLESLGYMGDDAFAAWWIENRTEHRPRGAFALHHELASRGVGRDVIARALEGFDEVVPATALALQQRTRYRHLGPAEIEAKVRTYLYRRGFEGSSIRAALAAAREREGNSG